MTASIYGCTPAAMSRGFDISPTTINGNSLSSVTYQANGGVLTISGTIGEESFGGDLHNWFGNAPFAVWVRDGWNMPGRFRLRTIGTIEAESNGGAFEFGCFCNGARTPIGVVLVDHQTVPISYDQCACGAFEIYCCSSELTEFPAGSGVLYRRHACSSVGASYWMHKNPTSVPSYALTTFETEFFFDPSGPQVTVEGGEASFCCNPITLRAAVEDFDLPCAIPGFGTPAYEWTVTDPDGDPVDVVQDHDSITFNPTKTGQYEAIVTYTDEEGLTGSDSTTVEVGPPTCLMVIGAMDWFDFEQIFVQSRIRDIASLALEEKGWDVDLMVEPSVSEIKARLQNACVQGLVYIGHGYLPDEESVWALPRNRSGELLTPDDIRTALAGRQLCFASLLGCVVNHDEWVEATGSPRYYKLPESDYCDRNSFMHGEAPPGGCFIDPIKLWWKGLAYFREWAEEPCCFAMDSEPVILAPTPDQAVASAAGTQVLASNMSQCGQDVWICNDSVCGIEAIGGVSCGNSIGPAIGGVARVVGPDSSWVVTTYVPNEFGDSVLVSAAEFYSEVPVSPSGTTFLHRMLRYSAALKESLTPPDSYSVRLSYSETELAGYPESQVFPAVVATDPSATIRPPFHLDTLLNQILLVSEVSGMIGLYAGAEQCGDINRSGGINIIDVVLLIQFVFRNGPPPKHVPLSDVNCDGVSDILDITTLINHVFRNQLAPQCPQCR